MPGCAAPGCTNHSRKGFRMFKFPRDVTRRTIWLKMTRRDKWTPTEYSCLCEAHFEESEYELHRRDGRKLLKNSAVPKLFSVPNKPTILKRKARFDYTSTAVSDSTSYVLVNKRRRLVNDDNETNTECKGKMDSALEMKQEPHSDSELDSLSAQAKIFSVDIKKETDSIGPIASIKSNTNLGEAMIVKNELPSQNKLNIVSVNNDITVLDMKEEDGEFPNPLSCVEVKYEILDSDTSSSVLLSQPSELATETSQKSSKMSKNQKYDSRISEKRHTCSACGKEYKMLCHLKSHILIHTGEKPYLCSACGKSFRLYSNLKMHSLIHSEERPHICERCGKAFAKRADLKQHFLTHTNEMPHKCSLCGKEFRHALSLKVHTRTHTGEKPYICSMCGRSFLTPSHLKTHTLYHTGEKPYVCNYCGRGFFTNKDLKRHLPIHSRDKPFVCSICNRGFCQKSQLEPHMLKKHNIETTHVCKVCGLTCVGIQTLRKHSQSHVKNK